MTKIIASVCNKLVISLLSRKGSCLQLLTVISKAILECHEEEKNQSAISLQLTGVKQAIAFSL